MVFLLRPVSKCFCFFFLKRFKIEKNLFDDIFGRIFGHFLETFLCQNCYVADVSQLETFQPEDLRLQVKVNKWQKATTANQNFVVGNFD